MKINLSNREFRNIIHEKNLNLEQQKRDKCSEILSYVNNYKISSVRNLYIISYKLHYNVVGNSNSKLYTAMLSGSHVTTAWHALSFGSRDGPQIWRVAANIMNKQ
jgi:hypothetical protein